MTLLFSGFLLALFGLSLILITLSLRLMRGPAQPGDAYHPAARFFLIALRLAIGWHCFVEGMEKINTPTWSSEPYLRESIGPLSSVYRSVAGDRLLEQWTIQPEDTFSPALEREWQIYSDAFSAHYDLDADQRKRLGDIHNAHRLRMKEFLKTKKETVVKIAPYPPDLELSLTMPQRLEEHARLVQRVQEAEAKFPSTDKDVHAEWRKAKADLAKWRTGLKKSFDAENNKLKAIDETMRAKVRKTITDLAEELKSAKTKAAVEKAQKALDEEKAKIWEPVTDVLTSEQRERGLVPEPIRTPIRSWGLLEYSDFKVKWGLVVLGAALMLGLLSRATSFALGLLVLSFYLAMPPLPGWPESPRLEGHYLLINKTLIEVIALFALTFIPTGRWAGLDGLLCLCCGGKAKEGPPPVTN